jgi:phenylpyruvate tautomerase PptA (4-oxalocrotonate tautomerase family)
MAIARIEVIGRRTGDERRTLMQAVRGAIVEALAVPAEDPTIQLVEHEAANVLPPFDFSTAYMLVTVTMFAGRSDDAKRRLYQEVTARLTALGVPQEEIDVVVHEPPLENWARGGVAACDREIPSDIGV